MPCLVAVDIGAFQSLNAFGKSLMDTCIYMNTPTSREYMSFTFKILYFAKRGRV